MKYTKEQLQGMSDFEVNKTIVNLLGFSVCDNFDFEHFELTESHVVTHNGSMAVDYCNNWNDVMPLAVEHDIDLINSYWYTPTATNDAEEIIKRGKVLNRYTHVSNDKPQRAIACCLILVLQENKK